jgi:hypothetical protein
MHKSRILELNFIVRFAAGLLLNQALALYHPAPSGCGSDSWKLRRSGGAPHPKITISAKLYRQLAPFLRTVPIVTLSGFFDPII